MQEDRMKTSIITACVAAGLLTTANVRAEDAAVSPFVGVKGCKICHKSPDKGDQFGKWEASPHAKAFEVLASDKAKAAGAKVGVENPQTSGKCLQCHSTAYNFTETKQSEVPVEEGVSCESCHGAGKNYKKKETMKSREECVKNGMVYPATKNCEKCHNDKSPTWDAAKYTTKDGKKAGFDAEQAAKKIEHPDPTQKK
jgi:Zn finger protein HypA/HybF involved in hydrogenase expression